MLLPGGEELESIWRTGDYPADTEAGLDSGHARTLRFAKSRKQRCVCVGALSPTRSRAQRNRSTSRFAADRHGVAVQADRALRCSVRWRSAVCLHLSLTTFTDTSRPATRCR